MLLLDIQPQTELLSVVVGISTAMIASPPARRCANITGRYLSDMSWFTLFALIFSLVVFALQIILSRKIDKRIDNIQRRIKELYGDKKATNSGV